MADFDFVECEIVIPGGRHPEFRMFRDNISGELYVGKCSLMALLGIVKPEEQLVAYVVAGSFDEEFRSAFALTLCSTLHVFVPPVVLAILPIAPRLELTGFGGITYEPKLHVLTRFERRFVHFGDGFITAYLTHARHSFNERMPVEVPEYAVENGVRRTAPLFGFGTFLAASALCDDRDPIGASGHNAGFIYDESSGVCRVMKLDATEAFEFMKGEPMRAVRVILTDLRRAVGFAALTAPDQAEFLATLQSALLNLQPRLIVEKLRSILTERVLELLPTGYLALLANGLSRRMASVTSQYRSDLDRVIGVEWELALQRLTMSVDLETDPERLHSDTVDLARRFGILRATIAAEVRTIEHEQGTCDTFQLPTAPQVIGRSAELNRLKLPDRVESELSTCREMHPGVYFIVGMGGIGKTTLAAQYANLAATGGTISGTVLNYGQVVWLRADNDDELDAQCVNLAEQWCGNTLSPSGARAELWHQFYNARRPVLVVLDNLTRVEKVRDLLPSSGMFANALNRVHVIITTRDVRRTNEVDIIQINTFSLTETIRYVRERVVNGASVDNGSIVRMHDIFGGLPLALVQTAAHMQHTGESLSQTIDHFNASFDSPEEFRQISDMRRVEFMITPVLTQLDATANDASAVLYCAAFLPPTALVGEILTTGSVVAIETFAFTIEQLLALGLFAKSGERLYSIHPLIQRYVWRWLKLVNSIPHVMTRLACALVGGISDPATEPLYLPSAIAFLDRRHFTEFQSDWYVPELPTLGLYTGRVLDRLRRPRESLKVIEVSLRYWLKDWDMNVPLAALIDGTMLSLQHDWSLEPDLCLRVIGNCYNSLGLSSAHFLQPLLQLEDANYRPSRAKANLGELLRELRHENTIRTMAANEQARDVTRDSTSSVLLEVNSAVAAVKRIVFLNERSAHGPALALQHELNHAQLSSFLNPLPIGQSVTTARGNYGVNSLVYTVTFGNITLVLKVLLNPYGSQANDTISLEALFSREYQLPCSPNTSLMPVLHWFKDSPSLLPGWPAPVDPPLPHEPPLRTLFIVTPRYDGALTAASRMRRERDNISERWLLCVLCPVLRGVQHLVRHNVLHMDLKLDNVLVRNAAFDAAHDGGVSPDLEVVLADFGCFMQVRNINEVAVEITMNREGNPSHRAPEFRSGRLLLDLSRAEVWAVGVMVHELVSGESPFGDQAPAVYVLDEHHALPHGKRWPLLARLVRAMLACEPRDRISVDDACLLAHGLLYGAPIHAESTFSDSGLEDALNTWRETKLNTLLLRSRDGQGGNGRASAWQAEAEYFCSLDVRMFLAAAAQWLA